MFGPTLAVQASAQLLALPSGFWSDSFESSMIELANRASGFDQTSSRRFQAESERALKALFRMSPLKFVGPLSDDSGIPRVPDGGRDRCQQGLGGWMNSIRTMSSRATRSGRSRSGT